METKGYISQIVTIVLLLLWIPVGLDKLLNFETFKSGILRQPFGDALGYALIYTLPILEIGVVLLLIFRGRPRWVGFGLSSLLMAGFTAYIGTALLGAWEKLPCGCGSVIAWMSWKQHFWFNLFFLVISVVGLLLHDKVRRRDVACSVSTDPENKNHRDVGSDVSSDGNICKTLLDCNPSTGSGGQSYTSKA